MPALTWAYCGICLYFSKASSQSAVFKGGIAPMIGFHSVMDSPDPVRRVTPPITTITNTRAAVANSHAATMRLRS